MSELRTRGDTGSFRKRKSGSLARISITFFLLKTSVPRWASRRVICDKVCCVGKRLPWHSARVCAQAEVDQSYNEVAHLILPDPSASCRRDSNGPPNSAWW